MESAWPTAQPTFCLLSVFPSSGWWAFYGDATATTCLTPALPLASDSDLPSPPHPATGGGRVKMGNNVHQSPPSAHPYRLATGSSRTSRALTPPEPYLDLAALALRPGPVRGTSLWKGTLSVGPAALPGPFSQEVGILCTPCRGWREVWGQKHGDEHLDIPSLEFEGTR